MIPTEDEYNALYTKIFNEHLQTYLDYYRIYEGCDNYEQLVEEGRETVLRDYGKEYFDELVLYDYAMAKIVSMAVIFIV